MEKKKYKRVPEGLRKLLNFIKLKIYLDSYLVLINKISIL